MILTEKTLEHYKIWFDKYYNDYWTYYQSKPTILNALIVEWFDSVGICIDRDCINMEMVITDFRDVKEKQTIIDCGLEEPFPDWWKKAIKKANEIYNEKYSISQ